jgi:hypothetical protein
MNNSIHLRKVFLNFTKQTIVMNRFRHQKKPIKKPHLSCIQFIINLKEKLVMTKKSNVI